MSTALERSAGRALTPDESAGPVLVPGPARRSSVVVGGWTPTPSRRVGGAIAGWAALNVVVNILPQELWTPAVTALLTAGGAAAAWPVLNRWRRQRQLDATTRYNSVEGLARGTRLSFAGSVLAAAGTFRTLTGEQAVLARYLGRLGTLRGSRLSRFYLESHALDFDLEVPGIAEQFKVRVRTEHLLLLPHPPRIVERDVRPLLGSDWQSEGKRHGWVYHHQCIVPGDQVVVAGTLDFVPDLSASSGSDRQPRMIPVLVGSPTQPALVTVVPPPQPPPRFLLTEYEEDQGGL